MNEEQKIRDMEISLTDLLFFCLEKWRIILVFMLLAGLVAGGYQYWNTRAENRIKQQEILAREAEKEERRSEEDRQEEVSAGEVHEIDREAAASYRQAIAESERSLQKQEEYLKQSVIMELDPYCISTGTLNYYLNGDNETRVLLSAYQIYIVDGILAEELHQANPKVSVEDLRYLISFVNNTDMAVGLNGDGLIQALPPEEAMFTIQIRMPNEELCDAYLRQAQKCMADYAYGLQTETAEHELSLTSSAQSEKTDLSIRDYQNALQSTHIAAVKNLQTLKAELDTILSVGEEAAAVEEEPEEEVTETEEIVLADPVSAAVKYAVLGAVMGAFSVCFLFVICYMMNGRLYNTEDFKTIYGIPLLSFVYILRKNGKFFGFIDRWIYQARCGVFAKISKEEQIMMAMLNVRAAVDRISGKETTRRIMLAGTIPERETAGLCGRIVAEMQEISFSAYQQMPFQSLTLGELENYDAVLFLEKRGVSYTRLIMQERELVRAGNVTILGAIVLN